MSELRAAIIGYGLAGEVFHAPLIAATPGLAVATVVTSSPERRARALRDHPGVRVVGRPDELWERAGEHELVVVAAPNEAHVPLAMRALDLGLPVVVDKPLALGAAEGRALVEHAERRGVLLTAFHNRRWDSDHLTLRRLIAEGELGEVLRYESRFERWRPEPRPGAWRETAPAAKGGGVLLDLGPHLVDQALELFGAVTDVHGEVDARRGGASDDDAFVALHHASGVHSHLWASAVAAAPGPRLRVLGTRGAYFVRGLDGQEAALRAGRLPGDGSPWGEEPEAGWGELVRGEERTPVPSEPGDWPRFYALLEAALRDGGSPPVDPGDAVIGLELLEAARRAAARSARAQSRRPPPAPR